MVSVAIVTTPNTGDAPDSVPRRVFDDVPNIEIDLERFVPLSDTAVPYLWVSGDGLDAFETALSSYPEISTVERLEDTEIGALYRIGWAVDSPMIHCIQRAGGRLVEAHGTAARWKLTVWFEPGADATVLLECCDKRGVPIDVERLLSLEEMARDDSTAVTVGQREAITTAYEAGYFERPRAISQRELADELGVSASALGTRLRRGLGNLVEQHFGL